MKTTEITSPISQKKHIPKEPFPLDACGLEIQITAGENQSLLGSESVTGSDLQEAVYEAWRECRLRKGVLESSPDDLPIGIKLVGEEGSKQNCKGYAVTMPRAGGEETAQYVFSVKSLGSVAERCAQKLQKNGLLKEDEQYYYHLVHSPETAPTPDLWEDESGVMMTVQKPALSLLKGSLNSLIEQSTLIKIPPGFQSHENAFQVFYTEAAFKKAEAFCRKGALTNPLFESGCILAGSLGYSSEGEMFVVVYEVYEVTDAEQTLVSLTYSGNDWHRIMNIVRMRQTKQPHFRILGQIHAHNFIPNNGECCEACPTRDHCDLTNLFTSSADREFHRAVFQNLPFGLCHILGLTARGDALNGMYTTHDGLLAIREYRILPDFSPDDYETITTA